MAPPDHWTLLHNKDMTNIIIMPRHLKKWPVWNFKIQCDILKVQNIPLQPTEGKLWTYMILRKWQTSLSSLHTTYRIELFTRWRDKVRKCETRHHKIIPAQTVHSSITHDGKHHQRHRSIRFHWWLIHQSMYTNSQFNRTNTIGSVNRVYFRSYIICF